MTEGRGLAAYLALVVCVFAALYVGLRAKSWVSMAFGFTLIFGAGLFAVSWLVR